MPYNGVVCNDFQLILLKAGIRRPNAELEVRLYSAVDPSISPTSDIEDFTETDFPGYNRIELADPFSISKDGEGIASALFDQVQFEPDGAGPAGEVLGYFVVELGQDILAWAAQLFDDPLSVDGDSDKIRIAPVFKQSAKFSST